MAIELCRAGTTGLSLLEKDAKAGEVFRWTNLAGKLETHVGGATPRGFSPCGITLDRNSLSFSHSRAATFTISMMSALLLLKVWLFRLACAIKLKALFGFFPTKKDWGSTLKTLGS